MTIEPRVDSLEDNMKAMAQNIIKMSNEMRDFKDEMSEFKDEMSEFKDEMSEFKDEMSEFKDELNVKWGNLSNQLGRVVQNLIIPNIDILIEKYFEETIIEAYPEVYKKSPVTKKRKEFDGIIVTTSYVFLFEVKNQVKSEYIDEFKEFVESGEFFDYFPHFKDKQLIPAMGSIQLKPHQTKYLSDTNILAVSIKGDLLEFENIEDLDLV